jgi:hypothetical protein
MPLEYATLALAESGSGLAAAMRPDQDVPVAGDQGVASLHARRALLTLEDTVEFFNLISELGLTAQEKADLVAFLRTL